MDLKYPTNVKIPLEYVRLIDEAMKEAGKLNGFRSRAQFVSQAVYEFLKKYGIQPTVVPGLQNNKHR